jgi:hypothetical protein
MTEIPKRLTPKPRFGDQTDRLGGMDGKKAILIFGYEDAGWPLEPAINAFAVIAARHGSLGPRCSAVYTPQIVCAHDDARLDEPPTRQASPSPPVPQELGGSTSLSNVLLWSCSAGQCGT